MQSFDGASATQSTPLPAPPELDADGVIRRMKEALEVKTDNELAKILGFSKGTVSSWRKRNAIPYDECVKVAYYTRSHLDWIINGNNEKVMYPGLMESNIDYKLIATIVYGVVIGDMFSSIENEWDRANFIARLIVIDYARYHAMMSEAAELGKMTKDDYLQALRRAIEASRMDGGDAV